MVRLRRVGVWGVAALVGVALVMSGQTVRAASIIDDGWAVVDEAGVRAVEMQASIVNDGAAPQSYQVRFTVESCKAADLVKTSKKAQTTEPVWSVASTAATEAVSVPAKSSAVVTKRIPYEQMEGGGKAYRFQAELLDAAGQVVAHTAIAPRDVEFMPLPAARQSGTAPTALAGSTLGLVALQRARLGGAPAALQTASHDASVPSAVRQSLPEFPGGRGVMEGTHVAQRVGGQWVEHGTGTITLRCKGGGVMTLDYVYDSQGTSAATLMATAQASGTYTGPGDQGTFAVSVPSANAQITFAGNRTQTGTVVTRTRAEATGTFTGTIDGQTFTGVLTITKGTETLDLATGQGTHSFIVRFTTK